MVDLTVDFAGVIFRNPIIAGSAPPTRDVEQIKKAEKAGVGGVVLKTASFEPKSWGYPRPRFKIVYKKQLPLFFATFGWETLSQFNPKDYMELYLKRAKKEVNIPIIASIMGRNIEEWVKLGQMVEEAGADMVELNVSGPHITEITETMGKYYGGITERAAEVTREVKKKVSIPIIAKLTPENPNLVTVAKAVKEAGAKGVTIMNAVMGLEIDIAKEAPILHSSYFGYAGPWLRPIGLKWVSKVAQETDIPISGLSGVVTWEDVIKYILVGATTIQISTGIMVKGYRLIGEAIRGLENFMKEKGYQKIEDVRGNALKNIIPLRDVQWAPLGSVLAFVDENICNGCNACVNSCFHDAIKLKNDIAQVNINVCEGCGLCSDVCPVDAITIRKI